jgi:hypothetical protein
MKKWGVSARKVACQGFALGCLIFIQLVGARSARAESPRKVEGYELLGTLGYGFGFWDSFSNDRQVDPFGVTVGGDFGYTFPFGLRLGTDAGYAFGRREKYTTWMGEVVTTHASSITWGGSIGYDLVLSSFRLRGAADVGLLLLLDDGSAAPWMYFGPKIGLTWQYRGVELGVQSRWMMWTGAIQMGLMAGTRF